VFTLGAVQKTGSFVTCYNLSKKVWIIIHCGDKITTDPHVVITFFLHQLSWYNVLADAIHLQIFTEDSATKISDPSAIISTVCDTTSCTCLTLPSIHNIAGHLRDHPSVCEATQTLWTGSCLPNTVSAAVLCSFSQLLAQCNVNLLTSSLLLWDICPLSIGN
jgi:hypothetical protein